MTCWPVCVCVCVCFWVMLLLGCWVVTLQRNMDQWSNTVDTNKVSAPSFNLHYTVHSLRSALLKWPPPCVSVLLASYFPFHVWHLCCHGYHLHTWCELLHRLSFVINWSVSTFKSSQDSSFFLLTFCLSLFLLKGCISQHPTTKQS